MIYDTHKELIEELNEEFAILLYPRARILQKYFNPCHGVPGCHVITKSDLKLNLDNRPPVEVVRENGKVRRVHLADFWLNHKDRRTFKTMPCVPGQVMWEG